jgi:hypothetical protein
LLHLPELRLLQQLLLLLLPLPPVLPAVSAAHTKVTVAPADLAYAPLRHKQQTAARKRTQGVSTTLLTV